MLTEIYGLKTENELLGVDGGLYELIESDYWDDGCNTLAKTIELQREGTGNTVACDLIVRLSNGDVLFRDFMKMPDGSWRDSYGRIADMLFDLLPIEIADFTLSRRSTRTIKLVGGEIIDSGSPIENAGKGDFHGT